MGRQVTARLLQSSSWSPGVSVRGSVFFKQLAVLAGSVLLALRYSYIIVTYILVLYPLLLDILPLQAHLGRPPPPLP